nr:MAG TPA: hypothetical protein [Caudoviricetes sp.]
MFSKHPSLSVLNQIFSWRYLFLVITFICFSQVFSVPLFIVYCLMLQI